MTELFYTTNEILNQQFKTKMRGYDPEEVDEFLDNIIRDYEAMQKRILELEEENELLEAENQRLVKNPVVSKSPEQAMPQKSAAVTNFDILKRLSNLEREVFGKKLNPQQSTAKPSSSVVETKEFEEPSLDSQATRLF